MNRVKQVISTTLTLALLSFGLTAAQAQTRRATSRANDARTGELIRRIENGAERFRSSLDTALDRGRLDGTSREDNINDLVDDFLHVVDHMQDRFNRRALAEADVDAVLLRAARIDNFASRNRLTPRAQRAWATLEVDLNELSRNFNVAWRRDTETFPAYPPADDSYNYDRGLTGTFRLNTSLSENPRTAVDLATRTLPARDRRATYDQVVARLEAPDAIAIERRGNTVTIASSRAPQINFEADGRARTERTASGDNVSARASFIGDQLTVSTTGDRDSDFTVTIDPIDNGQRLLITRRINSVNLREPVLVRSYYDRTSDVAQLDLYRETSPFPSNPGGRTNSGDFIIANGTTLTATLNNDLSTERTREGERFTMTVREPSQYAGATLEGTISNVKRSGRVSGRSELTFNFDRIRTRDGRNYSFAGFVEGVRNAEGETVRVDNEGTVQENDSQTDRTVQRTAIGTAVGAIIGAIAGGGKGAAIGAVLGAGGGAGSVYVQGQDDLQLRRGTELTIRATGPR